MISYFYKLISFVVACIFATSDVQGAMRLKRKDLASFVTSAADTAVDPHVSLHNARRKLIRLQPVPVGVPAEIAGGRPSTGPGAIFDQRIGLRTAEAAVDRSGALTLPVLPSAGAGVVRLLPMSALGLYGAAAAGVPSQQSSEHREGRFPVVTDGSSRSKTRGFGDDDALQWGQQLFHHDDNDHLSRHDDSKQATLVEDETEKDVVFEDEGSGEVEPRAQPLMTRSRRVPVSMLERDPMHPYDDMLASMERILSLSFDMGILLLKTLYG